MKNIVIRKVKYEDIEQIVDINIKDWKKVYKGIIDDSILDDINKNEKIERWKKNYNIGNVIVAEKNESIIGYCRYNDNVNDEEYKIDSEIIALYVDCDNSRNGIGKILMQYVIRDLKEKNKKNIIVWCLEKNINARKFYEKIGGKIVERKRNFEIKEKKYKEVEYVYDLKKV